MNSGDTKIITVIVKDADGILDISNATVKWQMAKQINSTPVVQKSTGAGITLTDPVNGVFEILLEPADTDGLGGKLWYHEGEIKLVDGTTSTIISGQINMLKTLIRST